MTGRGITRHDLADAQQMGRYDAGEKYTKANPFTREDPRWSAYEEAYDETAAAMQSKPLPEGVK